MNKSLRKELLREIRSSRNRFLSILIMVALGVMFLVGLRSAAPDMRATADSFFDSNRFYDIQILSTLGLTAEVVEAFSQVEGVETAEGGWSIDAMLTLGEMQKVVKAVSMDREFNDPTVVEGRLPETAGECAIDAKLQTALEVGIGDTVTLTPGEDMGDALTTEAFTITGVVESPLYISLDRGTSSLGDGSVLAFLLLPRESFALDYYTLCSIRGEGLAELDAYGGAYDAAVEQLTDRLETAAQDRADLRYETLLSDAQTQIDDAQTELDDARTEAGEKIADGEKELADARTELDDGWADLDEAKADLAQGETDGQQELDDALTQLTDARTELDDGWRQLQEAQDTLNSSQRELDSQRSSAQAQLDEAEQLLQENEALLAQQEQQLSESAAQVAQLRQQLQDYGAALEAQNRYVEQMEQAGTPVDPSTLPYDQATYDALAASLSQAEGELAQGQAQLNGAKAQLESGRNELAAQKAQVQSQLSAAQAQIDQGWADYNTAKAELDDGEAEYAQGLKDYQQGKLDFETELADGAQEIADAEQKLQDGERDYTDGLAELEEARTEADQKLSDAQAEIDDARQQLADLEPADVYVLDRDSNYGFVSYDQNAKRMENLAQMFPLIFFVVAALVCLTTMTRMVEEERTQIGTIKAMGYGTGTIAWKFLIYGMLAAIGGTVLGAVVGTTLIPWVIFTSYGIMYTIPDLQLTVHWGLCLGAGAAGLACTMGATLWAMLATARSTPAQLMRPKTPKAGKRIFLERITPLWRRMSFSMKVSARNLLRYKKRFWMTVIGVAGCTALMISGLGLRSSIFSIIDLQYGEIFRYNVQAALDTDVEGVQEDLRSYLQGHDNVASMAEVYSRAVTFLGDGVNADGHLTVTDDPEALSQQISFRDMKRGQPLTLTDDGVIIDEKLAEQLDVGPGDEITMDCGRIVKLRVTGVMEHYVNHFAYMTLTYYNSVVGEDFAPNTFMVTAEDPSEAAISALCEDLMSQEGVSSATNLGASARSFRETLEVVNAAVTIIILSAAALALVVLYNLTNINITERLRELATIKVLGFYDGEVAMYIYRENIVLTFLGIALGQVLGKFLCTYLIRTIEMDFVMFGREALGHNYLVSVILSLAFAVIVNILMYFRMKKIDMIQSLKSVE